MSDKKKLITEVNDNAEGSGTSVRNINETEFPAEGMQPLPTTSDEDGEKEEKEKD